MNKLNISHIRKSTFLLSVFILSSVLFFGSCVKERPATNPGVNTGNEEELEIGAFSFRFSESMATRIEDELNYGTTHEQAVENVWVLLYGNEAEQSSELGTSEKHHLLKYAWNLDIKKKPGDNVYSGEDVANGSAHGFVAKAKMVERKKYKLVVIVNPGFYAGENTTDRFFGLKHFTNGYYTDLGEWIPYNDENKVVKLSLNEAWSTLEYLRQTNGDPKGLAEKQITEIHTDIHLHKSINQTPAYFLMSNANGAVGVTERNIFGSAQHAEGNPVKVNVDRAVAKIVVNADLDAPYTTTTGGTVTDLTWGLKNINKQTYIYRQFANVFDPSQPECKGIMETEDNSRNYIRSVKYATDPNFNLGNNNPNLAANFKSEDLSDYIEWNTGTSEAEEKNWKYAPENTLSLTDQTIGPAIPGATMPYTDFVTTVAVRAHIQYDFEDGFENANGSYYSYSYTDGILTTHKVFTYKEAIKWLQDGKVPSDFGNELYALLQLSDFFTGGPGNDEDTNVTVDNTGKIFFHPKGLNEYEIPIEHFSFKGYSTGMDTYGYLGVVRNNIYRINIKSFDGPGVPADGSCYISANISVQPWYIRQQFEDLE